MATMQRTRDNHYLQGLWHLFKDVKSCVFISQIPFHLAIGICSTWFVCDEWITLQTCYQAFSDFSLPAGLSKKKKKKKKHEKKTPHFQERKNTITAKKRALFYIIIDLKGIFCLTSLHKISLFNMFITTNYLFWVVSLIFQTPTFLQISKTLLMTTVSHKF